MWTWVDRFFEWCYVAPALSIIRDTRFGMPIAQTFHLLGITMLLGMTIVLGLRLMNVGFRRIALDTLVAQLWPWMKWALALIVVSGVLVFIVDPLRYVASGPFRFKMLTLCIAILFHFTLFRAWVRRRGGGPAIPGAPPTKKHWRRRRRAPLERADGGLRADALVQRGVGGPHDRLSLRRRSVVLGTTRVEPRHTSATDGAAVTSGERWLRRGVLAVPILVGLQVLLGLGYRWQAWGIELHVLAAMCIVYLTIQVSTAIGRRAAPAGRLRWVRAAALWAVLLQTVLGIATLVMQLIDESSGGARIWGPAAHTLAQSLFCMRLSRWQWAPRAATGANPNTR